jgi:ParB family chromosome partitioning protein
MATGDSSIKRRGLGRGLAALIVNTERAPAPMDEPQPSVQAGVAQIPVDQIAPNPQQPRTHFDPAALEELAMSIRAHGIIQPLIVTYDPDRPGAYWLVAGERRWRAAQLAELAEVPAIVRDASPVQLLEWALVENLQRADLNPLEEAAAYQTLLDEFALTQAEIGARVGKSRSAVANTVRLLLLPRPAQEALTAGQVSAGHARALLGLPDEELMLRVLDQIVARDLTVRQTEDLVNRLVTAPPQPAAQPQRAADPEPALDGYFSHLENRFRTVLGTRVNLTRNRDGSGRLVVHFFSDDDLSHLVQVITGEESL